VSCPCPPSLPFSLPPSLSSSEPCLLRRQSPAQHPRHRYVLPPSLFPSLPPGVACLCAFCFFLPFPPSLPPSPSCPPRRARHSDTHLPIPLTATPPTHPPTPPSLPPSLPPSSQPGSPSKSGRLSPVFDLTPSTWGRTLPTPLLTDRAPGKVSKPASPPSLPLVSATSSPSL